MTETENKNTPSSKDRDQDTKVQLTRSELPAYCPTEEMGLYSSHPRVYIPLEEERQASCPYCGTEFELVDE